MRLGMLIAFGIVLTIGSAFPDGTLGWFDSETSDVGLAFLKVGVGGRSVGMGGAYSAVCGDATSCYWNPAGVIWTEGGDVVLHHNEHFQGIRHEFLGISSKKGNQGFGLGIAGLYADGLELRKGAQAEPDGQFGAYDFFVSCSYAHSLSRDVAFGLTLKAVHERIYFHTATGWALDLGLLYETGLKGLRMGGSVQNLGPRVTFEERGYRLPNTYRLGLSYALPFPVFNGSFLLAFDGVKSIDSVLRANLGCEYDYNGVVKARMGYKFRYDAENLSCGIGFGLGRYRLDYAYIPYQYDLGSGHLVTLGLRL